MKLSLRLTTVLLAVLISWTPAVLAYEAWTPPAADTGIERLDEYADILERFGEAVQRAITAQAAHPLFLDDLVDFHAELTALLAFWHSPAAEQTWGDYSSAAAIPSVTGVWNVRANVTTGTLELQQSGAAISGRIFGDELRDGRIGADGSIHFVRTGSNQVYTGTLSQDSSGQWVLEGTFDCPVTGGRGVSWRAVKNP